mmetsp:Transcript_39046/g.37365  ORF Transcript_39046/g.37365 Transcript_39046/m.37365 type:complete len:85 (-) Transcript_39046:624-878(-)
MSKQYQKFKMINEFSQQVHGTSLKQITKNEGGSESQASLSIDDQQPEEVRRESIYTLAMIKNPLAKQKHTKQRQFEMNTPYLAY